MECTQEQYDTLQNITSKDAIPEPPLKMSERIALRALVWWEYVEQYKKVK